jgi:3-oxoacyl-[acyl-carrier protein] reductase
MSSQGRLANKKAIITGAGLGLGEGIARKFVTEGARVLLFEIHPENGKRVAASLNSSKVVAVTFTGDATKDEDWQRAVDTCVKTFGGLDIVVNNAGVVHRAAVSEGKERKEDRSPSAGALF